MKKFFFTLSSTIFYFAAYCQLPVISSNATATVSTYSHYVDTACDELTKTETYPGGKIMNSAKEPIIISNGGLPLIRIVLVKGTNGLIMNIGLVNRDLLCISKNAEAKINFTDNTEIIINHLSDLDCEGNFTSFLGDDFMNKKELDILKSKKIKNATITYTEVVDEKIKKFNKTYNFTKEEGEKVMKTINCLTN